jgi:predicted transposase YbfD/YdcC
LPKKTALIAITSGADVLLALKDNQPTLHQLARDKLDGRPADWRSDMETDHGRIEWRELRVCCFDLDIAAFPGARQLVSLTRYHCEKKNGGDFTSETRHFITTLRESDASHARLAGIVRGHWSVENKNHWRKDATVWREDRCVRRKPKGAKNLALLRNAILALIDPDQHASLNQAFLHYADHRAEAIRLITKSTPCNP